METGALVGWAISSKFGMHPNRSFDAGTQRHCAANRMLSRTARGAMPLRAGQLRH